MGVVLIYWPSGDDLLAKTGPMTGKDLLPMTTSYC